MDLFLVDAIGPFFRGVERTRINWSKIPFDHWEHDGGFADTRRPELERDLRAFARRAAAEGFTDATLDDLAHLADHPAHGLETRGLIAAFQSAYRPLFDILAEEGLGAWVTADTLSFSAQTEVSHGGSFESALPLLTESLESFFTTFPAVRGVVLRMGESDGLDVRGAFRSRLVVRTPAQCRALLEGILPVFEREGKTLVFRTWSVGAYPVGDLQWNRDTYRAVFEGLESAALIVSIKYGETDFFRYLPINKQFFRGPQRKLIELPARREYEGCGEYPSFIGWDYEQFRRELSRAEGMVGVMVWVQTGGWTCFRRLTYLDPAAVWTEINAHVILRLFRDGVNTAEAIRSWWVKTRGSDDGWLRLHELLRLSDEVVKELLYVDEFARQKLFFRRTRIPPLLTVYWDHVLVNHGMRKILRSYVRDPEDQVRRAWAALDKIAEMRLHAEAAELPAGDIAFMGHTFEILALAREYHLLPYSAERTEQLETLKAEYKLRYPHRHRYAIKLDFRRLRLGRLWLRGLLSLFVRRKRGYRVVDRLVTVYLLGKLHPLLLRRPGLVPEFFRSQAMGIESILK